jgi:hypothetical protein
MYVCMYGSCSRASSRPNLDYVASVGKMVQPVLMAAQSKTYVYGRSPTAIMDSNPTGGMDVCLLCLLCVVR